MTLTREEVQALLEGITSGEWQADEKGVISPGQLSHGRDYRRIANVHVRASYATPELDVENGANSRLLANAPTLARQLLAEMDARQAAEKEVERLAKERDEADRRAGAAERQMESLEDAAIKRRHWLSEAKRQAGYHDNVSFDVVWAETLAKAQALSPQPEPEAPHG